MSMQDPISDMLTRIRNGQMRSLNSVEIPSSNFRKNILEILKNEGYIKDFFIDKSENNKTSLKVTLKYYEGYPVIKEIKRISKPLDPEELNEKQIKGNLSLQEYGYSSVIYSKNNNPLFKIPGVTLSK